jgi:hypothetical protein
MVLGLQILGPGKRRARPDVMRPSMLIPTLIILLLACLALQGCLLFTESVNAPPVIHEILVADGPIFRSQAIKLTVRVSDPDGGDVTLGWSTSEGACPEPLDPAQRPAAVVTQSSDLPFSFEFLPGAATKVCVFVLARDPQGATAVAARTLSSENRPPVAVIKVLEPSTRTSGGLYELHSIFHLSAAASQDPDGDPIQQPKFNLVGFPPAAMPTPALVPCPSHTPTDLVTCLDVGRFAGTYAVTLDVSDGLDRSATITTMLAVDEDHPACVSSTDPGTDASPIVLDPREAKTFTIKEILDDGAPLPTPVDGAHDRPTFEWTLRRNGGAPQPIAGYANVNALTLPGSTYLTGDVVDVSVTISDGVAMHLQPACDPRCPAGCPQSAQWTVSYR